MSFSAFMASQNVSTKLSQFIRYALAFLDCPEEDPPASVVLHRLRLFLKSIGRFSAGSFLYPLYGCGDLAPGFVRSSAVKGGIFILDWNPKAIVVQRMEYHDVPSTKGFVFCTENETVYVVLSVEEPDDSGSDDSERIWKVMNLFDGQTNSMKITSEMTTTPLIGRRFEMASGYRYEVDSLRVRMTEQEGIEVVVRCLLSPQIPLDPKMHDVPKCVYLEVGQLRYVRWISASTERVEDIKTSVGGGGEVKRCSGVITASDQFIRTKYVVGAADYFKDSIESVAVKHIRMTVISAGPISGTVLAAKSKETTSDDDEDSDSSDSERDPNEGGKEESKEKVTEKSHCCVVHIPPNTTPFDNSYSIHIIQLDHYSCTVPPPLCLTFFWMQCGDDKEDAMRSMERCFELFYRTQVIVDGDDEEKEEEVGSGRPLGLMKTVYEQRVRTVNRERFAENVYIVEDLNDTIGYENAVQSAKSLFKSMFPRDPWMEKDKPAAPKQTRADKVFSALEESKENGNESNEAANQSGAKPDDDTQKKEGDKPRSKTSAAD